MNRRKERMTPNQHGLYVLGYTHDTMAGTKGSKVVRRSLIPAKPAPVQIEV